MPTDRHHPTNIFLLCKEYEVEFDDLRLICIYCKAELTEGEVLAFAVKELFVVWKYDFPHGVCMKCLCREARVRELRLWEYSSYGSTVEEETGLPLAQIYIRCHACCKPLCYQEKEHMVASRMHFHKISGHWTGKCCNCRVTCTAIRRR